MEWLHRMLAGTIYPGELFRQANTETTLKFICLGMAENYIQDGGRFSFFNSGYRSDWPGHESPPAADVVRAVLQRPQSSRFLLFKFCSPTWIDKTRA